VAAQVTAAGVVAGLRGWAAGSYADEAAVELLARAFGGRFASLAYPWVRRGDSGRPWLDPARFVDATGVYSGGEQRVLSVVEALTGGRPVPDLPGVLAGVDRPTLALVLAAFSHAAGAHEHQETSHGAQGLLFSRPGPVVAWPAVVGPVR
jgi:hypothetical protein